MGNNLVREHQFTGDTDPDLVSIAKYLIGETREKPLEAILRMKRYLGKRGLITYQNHKHLWPAQVRPISRYVTDDSAGFLLTPTEEKLLLELINIIGPSY